MKRMTTIKLGISIVAIILTGCSNSHPQIITPTPTSNPLNMGRAEATSTLLPNGKVLIAGGASAYSGLTNKPQYQPALASAEIYDPNTGTFSPTGNLIAPRAEATAILLKNGEVLISGGVSTVYQTGDPAGLAPLKSAEIYNPATATFSSTGNMNVGRVGAVGSLLPDGRVLIAGSLFNGTGGEDGYNFSAEIYDPSSGTFTSTGSMNYDHSGQATALPLSNGSVLIAGGGCCKSGYEVYNPQSDSFQGVSMKNSLLTAAVAKLPDNNVLALRFHPMGSINTPNTSEIYNPLTNIFTDSSDFSSAFDGVLYLVPAGNQNMLVIGSEPNKTSGGEYPLCQVYTIQSGVFSPTGCLNTIRYGAMVIPLPNGKVLIAGGVPANSTGNTVNALDTAELYDPATGVFSSTGNM